jgi:hypothetical protein
MQEEYWQFVEGAKEGAVSGRGQWKGRNAKRWCEAVRMTQRPSLRVRGNRRKSEKAAHDAKALTACPGKSSEIREGRACQRVKRG